MFPRKSQTAAKFIQNKIKNRRPQIAMILGSGLGEIAEQISSKIEIPYTKIPGFIHSKIKGHKGKLIIGKLENKNVICMQGRKHLYEGVSPQDISHMIFTLKLLGCETLIITNAAGSMNTEIPVGGLMCIADHINFQFQNPLIGINSNHAFVSMENAYDADLRKKLFDIAEQNGVLLYEGVYVGLLGPSFETPAEIRAFRVLGADAVGMSTVQEVIAARYCGMRVVGISAISNLAAGISEEELSHEHTLQGAHLAVPELTKLLLSFITSY